MSSIVLGEITLPGANLGNDNPLPDISFTFDVHGNFKMDESIPKEELHTFELGKISTILPYTKNTEFDRATDIQRFNSVTLENDYLKATFIPDLGGRLWSLYDKEKEKDLLYVNPYFRPVNLAVRGAWVSGGVEWNIGMTGHSPFTVSKMFYSVSKFDDGTSVLRMYEWERIRQAIFQIDAYLPKNSKFLYVRVKIINTLDEVIPMYWWSNIAVDESEHVRAIAPSSKCYLFDYTQTLSKVNFPQYMGVDASYPENLDRAVDFFFDIDPKERKYITAIDKNGYGLVQASTNRLQGRKIFVWGMGVGGRRWQEFLSEPGQKYLEIQAGLAHTQMQHLPMAPHEEWQWLEAYGALQTNAKDAHANDWLHAYTSVTKTVDNILPHTCLEDELKRVEKELANLEFELIGKGSGWAALEAEKRSDLSEIFKKSKLDFTKSSIGEAEIQWLKLFKQGILEYQSPNVNPKSYVVGNEWLEKLKQALNKKENDHYLTWYYYGVACYLERNFKSAQQAWETSISREYNVWSLRCLAILHAEQYKAIDTALNLYEDALKHKQDVLSLIIECGNFFVKHHQAQRFLSLFESFPARIKNHGRVKFIYARALNAVDRLDEATDILLSGIVVGDIREGEPSLSDLWIDIATKKIKKVSNEGDTEMLKQKAVEKYPVPTAIDFRM